MTISAQLIFKGVRKISSLNQLHVWKKFKSFYSMLSPNTLKVPKSLFLLALLESNVTVLVHILHKHFREAQWAST